MRKEVFGLSRQAWQMTKGMRGFRVLGQERTNLVQ